MARYALVITGFVVLTVTSAAHAQVVDDAMTEFIPPAGMFASAPRLTSPEDGQRIIRTTLGSSASYGQQVLDTIRDKDFYVIIHLLKWAAPTFDDAGIATQTVQEQNWYIYRGGSGWSQTDFSAKRMYGGKGFYLLAIHLNREEQVGYYRLNYRYTITKKQPANITNLLAAAKLLGAGGLAGSSVAEPKPKHLWAGHHVSVDDVPSDISIVPEIVPIDRPPDSGPATTSINNPVSQPGVIGPLPPIPGNGGQGGQPPTAPPQGGGQPQPATPSPQAQSDKDIALLRQQVAALEKTLEAVNTKPNAKEPQSLGATHKIDNEGKYYWDVSVGIPVRGVNDFTRTETGIEVTEVSKDTVFVMANIYFKPVDVKTPALNIMPSLLLGVGIEKTPLGRFFIGGGWGPVYANFFAGVSFKKIENTSDYETEVTFGLNVPILSITKRLAEQAK